MKQAGINNEKLAAACGVAAPTSYNWGSGKTKKIKAEPLLKAAELFGVTPGWLATGAQPKYKSNGEQPAAFESTKPYPATPALDKMSTELLSLFNQLDKPSKHEYLGQLRGFVIGRKQSKDPPAEQLPPANNERTGTHD